jgi:hypothetical protein
MPVEDAGAPTVIFVPNVGAVENTSEPEPVSFVTAAAKLALVGVAKNVATPVPRPLTPVLIGSPVAFDKVILLGVPRLGDMSVALSARTLLPVPVDVSEPKTAPLLINKTSPTAPPPVTTVVPTTKLPETVDQLPSPRK